MDQEEQVIKEINYQERLLKEVLNDYEEDDGEYTRYSFKRLHKYSENFSKKKKNINRRV